MRTWQQSNRDYSVHFYAASVDGGHGTPPAGTFDLIPGSGGNDNLTGTTGDDTFDLTAGGDDQASGLDGNDTFNMGAAFTAFDRIDGGDGYDTLVLDGDYSAAVAMRAPTLTGIEAIQLTAGHSYNLIPNDAAVAQPLSITVDGSTLGAGDVLIFDAHKEAGGSYSVTAGAADDELTGGDGVDALDGGNGRDILSGRGGSDSMDGGSGVDTVDYSYGGPIVVDLWGNSASEQGGSGDQVYNFENIVGSGFDDVLYDNDKNNTITGGLGNDGIYLWHGGSDTGKGGDGDDTFVMDKALSVGDRLIGGDGFDTVNLGETAPIVLGAKTISGIEEITLTGGWSYDITSNDRNVAKNQILTITGTPLQTTDSVHFNGSAERNGSFEFDGGHGNDVFVGGRKSDVLVGGEGEDTLTGGLGADTFKYNGVSDAYHSSFDDVTDFDAASDNFDLWFAVSGIDAGVSCADLGDLPTAADAAHLAAGHALVATVGSDTFLVVDANAADGYQQGEDLLVRISGATNLGDLTAADFV